MLGDRPRRRTPSRTSSALRSVRAVGTQRPSSENTRTPASTISPISASDLALEAVRDRPDGEDVGEAGAGGRGPDLVDDHGCVVGDGVRVRHRRDRRVAAGRGGPGAGLDGLLVLVAGLAQVRVQVDQARARGRARRSRRPRPTPPSSRGPASATRPSAHVRRPRTSSRPAGRVDHPGAAEEQLGTRSPERLLPDSPRPPSSRYRSAIRPRCRSSPGPRSPRCGRSATSESISTPRFIGPGCMISDPSGSSPHAARGSGRTGARTRARSGSTRGAVAPSGRGAGSTTSSFGQHPVDVVAHLHAPRRARRAGSAWAGPRASRRRPSSRGRTRATAPPASAGRRPTIATRRPLEAAEPLAHRVQVEERLRRVLVRAVAGVQHVRVEPSLRELQRRIRTTSAGSRSRPPPSPAA